MPASSLRKSPSHKPTNSINPPISRLNVNERPILRLQWGKGSTVDLHGGGGGGEGGTATKQSNTMFFKMIKQARRSIVLSSLQVDHRALTILSRNAFSASEQSKRRKAWRSVSIIAP